MPDDRAESAGTRSPDQNSFPDDQRAAVYRAIDERRDVRRDFVPDLIPADVLERVLAAAHRAPSVGFSQPWDFIVITDPGRRARVKALAERSRDDFAGSLPAARARAFDRLKTEAILQTPVNIVVTCDPTRGGRHTLGRHAQPQTAAYSSVLAVANLWLAARAEGLGVGWVSFFSERELAAELGLPPHLEVVAYLCVGYVTSFAPEPELAQAGWARRRPLSWAVHAEEYGRRELPGREAVSLLDEVVAAIRPLDDDAVAAARHRQAQMTKPAGSLGVLEDVSVQLSGLAGACPPPMPEPAAVAIFAADHGVHAQGVTPWPQEVTGQMVANFLAGGAVVNAFAAQAGAEVLVVDVGVGSDLDQVPGLLPRKIGQGHRGLHHRSGDEPGAGSSGDRGGHRGRAGPGGGRQQVPADRRYGHRQHHRFGRPDLRLHRPGRRAVTGRGTGVDDVTLARKVAVVERGLALHQPDRSDPLGTLAAVGGFEHAALAGYIIAAAALRVPVILDGVIAGSAALAACALAPGAACCLIAGHRSVEPGHSIAMEHLGLRPLVDLDLRLGEGTGALLALPIVQSAVRALREVATFDSAGVTEK